MSLTYVEQTADGDWIVWTSMGNGDSPVTEPEAFVIGCGETREEAVAMAVADLQQQIADLTPATDVAPGLHVATRSTSVFQDQS